MPPPSRRLPTLAAAAALASFACLLGTATAVAPRPAAGAQAGLPRHTQPLAGPRRTLSNGEGVKLGVSVPVKALQAMEDAGLVGDPLWR